MRCSVLKHRSEFGVRFLFCEEAHLLIRPLLDESGTYEITVQRALGMEHFYLAHGFDFMQEVDVPEHVIDFAKKIHERHEITLNEVIELQDLRLSKDKINSIMSHLYDLEQTDLKIMRVSARYQHEIGELLAKLIAEEVR